MAADPHQTLAQLPMLTDVERREILVEWNNTATEEPSTRCVHQRFEEQVLRTPDAPAVEFDGHILTYQQLNERANQLAHYLQQHGAAPDVLVGVCLERSIEMLVGILAILKAGSAYVPLDPTYPPARLATMLEDAHAPLLLTLQDLKATLPQSAAQVVCLDADWHEIQTFPHHNPTSSVGPDNLVYVIYTSGSTGTPKGAGVYHRGFSNLVNWFVEEFDFNASDHSLLVTSISFDLTQKNLYAVLSVGGVLHLAPAGLYDPEVIADRIGSCGITHLNCTPSHFYPLVGEGSERSYERLASLRYVYLGGEPIDVGRLWGWLGDGLCGAQIVNTYGPTECSDIATFYRLPKGLLPSSEALPIGSAISNVRVYLLDAHQRLVPVGVAGEIYIGGVGVGHGYLGRSGLTAEKFVGDPFSEEPGARLYRTGDVGRYDAAGKIVYLGRMDHQVKVRGFRIELGEIESVLSAHSGVREAVVLAREDVPGDRRLVAYLVGSDAIANVSSLREHLRERLPYYMVPSAFVVLESLPLSPNGKVDRKALPAPEGVYAPASDDFEAPINPVEETLASIWRQVLRLEQVGRNDNFFELGGNSILSIQIIARANAAGLRLIPRQVFEHQTIAGLAAVAGTETLEVAEQGTITGEAPLTPIQRWFFEQERAEAHHFNQSRLLRLDNVTPETVRAVVSALVAHHDALRGRFIREDDGWHQRFAEVEENEFFSVVDLSSTPEGEQSAAITTTCSRLQASLNLSEGPLLRVCYFDLGPDLPARLLFAIHHLVMDGVSWRVLLEDLASGILQLQRGEAVSLPAKTISFQAWAQRLEEYARSEELQAEWAYWQGVCSKPGEPLPRDYPQGANTSSAERVVRVRLEAEETRALLQEVPAVYHTQINDVLLTALVESLSVWTGSRSLVVNLEGHGRETLLRG